PLRTRAGASCRTPLTPVILRSPSVEQGGSSQQGSDFPAPGSRFVAPAIRVPGGPGSRFLDNYVPIWCHTCRAYPYLERERTRGCCAPPGPTVVPARQSALEV